MDANRRGILLFRRDYRGFSGGHLKVWQYFRHATASPVVRPRMYVVPGSIRGDDNPFDSDPDRLAAEWRPDLAAALFVAGLDWRAVPEDLGRPVINLVQGVRHADPDDERRVYLARRAVRICVSPEVADAIRATRRVNGPIVTIPNAIDVPCAERPAPHDSARPPSVLLAGWKEPVRTRRVADRLRAAGIDPDVIDAPRPRGEYLRRVAAAGIVVFLPLDREGCFLPALEAFALGSLVVCPDCVGNRSFCRDGDTCLRPAATDDAIVEATRFAIALSADRRREIVGAARREAAGRTLDVERGRFLALIEDLAAGW